MIDLSQDFDLLCDAAREAAALAMSYWSRAILHERKSDGTIVTEADTAVDKLLARRLRDARPRYGWLSEESAEHTARLSAKRVWIIDPIDGTRDFLHGGRDWTVAICLAFEGAPVLSCLINPVRQQIFAARIGTGTRLNGRLVHTSRQNELAGAKVAAAPPFKKAGWRAPWREAVPIYANSTLYRLALVASGEADTSFALNTKWEWDIAAGALLVSEAGGVITAPSGAPLKFNSTEAKVEGFVAAAGDLHQILIENLSGRAKAPLLGGRHGV